MSAPPIDPSFVSELEDYSRQATGMPGQYRAHWVDRLALWTIQKREPGELQWKPVIAVFEPTFDDEGDMTMEYRPLDRRAIIDLIEADLANKHFSTGDIERDRVAFTKWKEEFARFRENERLSGIKMKIADITANAEYHRKKLEYAMSVGHTNGFKQFFQVAASTPTAKADGT